MRKKTGLVAIASAFSLAACEQKREPVIKQPVKTVAPAPPSMPVEKGNIAPTYFKIGTPEFNVTIWNGVDVNGQDVKVTLPVDADLLGPGGVLTASFLAQLDPHMADAAQLEALREKSPVAWNQKIKTLKQIEANKDSTEPYLISALMDYLYKNHRLSREDIELVRLKAASKANAAVSAPSSGPG